MKISIPAKRRIENLLSILSDDLAYDLLDKLGMEQSKPLERFSTLDDKFEGDWSTANFRKLWVASEISNLFKSYVTVFKTKSKKLTLTELKKKLIDEEIKKDKVIALELHKKPKLYQLSCTTENCKTMISKAATDKFVRDSIYWLPDLGIVMTQLHDDEDGDLLKKTFQDKITGKWESFRFISLVISKFYNDNRMISKLVVNAMAQITGFDGLDHISFQGDDVKAGLGGLHRRQDIRVHLDQIGPNIAVSSENIELQIGNQVRIKNFKGITELEHILYPEK